MGIFNDNKTVWKVSWKWAIKKIDCTLHGITTRCKGKCCTNPAFWPPRVDGGCKFLTEKGCSLEVDERPVICLLYPLSVNKNNTLVLHHRCMNSSCKPNYKQGENSIFENMKDHLVSLFGEDQYIRVLNDIKNERDSYFNVSRHVLDCIEMEEKLHQMNVNPIKQSQVKANKRKVDGK